LPFLALRLISMTGSRLRLRRLNKYLYSDSDLISGLISGLISIADVLPHSKLFTLALFDIALCEITLIPISMLHFRF